MFLAFTYTLNIAYLAISVNMFPQTTTTMKSMEVIQVGEYKFDALNSCLSKDEQVIPLDPRLLTLLTFFVENPNRIITRDELQLAIWQNVIVTDNAINKLVANLRKLFCDDAKNPQYVKTIPKQGYVFIAQISSVEPKKAASEQTREKTENTDQVQPVSSRTHTPYFVAFFAVMIFALGYIALYSPTSSVFGDSAALSRFYGGKGSPIVTQDGETLLFLNHRQQGTGLWQTAVNAGNATLPKEIKGLPGFGELLFADSSKLMYRVKAPECGWYVSDLDLNASTVSPESTLLTSCNSLKIHWSLYLPMQNRLFALGHDKHHEHRNTLFSATVGEPLQALNIELSDKWRMVSLDTYKDANKLLITTISIDGKTAVFEYQIDQSILTPVIELDFFSHHVIWDQEREGLVYTTPAPDSKLMRMDLTSREQTLLSSSSERLCCTIARHPNGVDYIYLSSDKNIDVKWLKTNYWLDNSSVIDSNPALAHTKEGHYFLSNRAGLTQLYFQSPNSPATLVPLLDDYYMIEKMALSNNDEFILLSESHRLLLSNLNERNSLQSIFLDGYIDHIQWLTNTLFSVSMTYQNQRYVEVYNSNLQRIARLEAPWRQVLANPSNDNWYYFVDSNRDLYRMPTDRIFTTPSVDIGEYVGHLPMYSKLKVDNNILYLVSEFGETLSRYTVSGDIFQPLSEEPLNAYLGFDVKADTVIFAGKETFRSQVYRTVAK